MIRAAVFLSVCCVLFSVSLNAAPPTAEQVASAVEKSRAEWLRYNRPPTQEEAVAALEKELAELYDARKRTRLIQDPAKRTSEAKRIAERIPAARKELLTVKQNYEPPAVEPKVLPFADYEKLKVGDVGRRDAAPGKMVRCQQILGPDRFLGQVEFNGQSGLQRAEFYEGGPFLFLGFDTSTMQEDSQYPLEFHAVVSGQYTYTAVSGARKTVMVLEQFEPDEPFVSKLREPQR